MGLQEYFLMSVKDTVSGLEAMKMAMADGVKIEMGRIKIGQVMNMATRKQKIQEKFNQHYVSVCLM